MTASERLKGIMATFGYNIGKIIKFTGLSRRTVRRIRSGKLVPPDGFFRKLGGLLQVAQHRRLRLRRGGQSRVNEA